MISVIGSALLVVLALAASALVVLDRLAEKAGDEFEKALNEKRLRI